MSDDRTDHVRALLITTAAALAGVGSALVGRVLTADLGAEAAATSRNAQLVLLAAVVLQLPVYELAFDEWGGPKDVLYVAFMTFVLWFVTLGILLTTGAQPI